MGSKGSSTTSTSQPPKEVMEMYKYLTSQGKSLQQEPYKAYTGELVPEMNQYQTAALGQTAQYANAADPYLSRAGTETASVMQGFQPEQFSQGVKDFMSPYISNVAEAVNKNLTESQAQDRNAVLSKMIGSGAFGGDRGGIVGAELSRQQGLARAGAMAPIYQQGYTQAADLYGKSLAGRLGAANQYGGVGEAIQKAGLGGAGALGTAGQVPYQIQAAKDAAAYQQFAQKQAYPFQTLGFLANIASGLGAGMGGTTTQTQPGPSWLSQLAGMGTLFSMLPMSDERVKEDMEPVGKTFDGQTIYKYRLKGDGVTQIGLSAQEVEKRTPEAVGKDNHGIRHVDYDAATEGAAKRGHFMAGGVSQGGLVPASADRMPFASFGFVPYKEDPLMESMAKKYSLASYVPEGEIARMANKLPDPVRLEDTSFDTKGLSPYAAKGISRLYSGAQMALGLGKDPLYYNLGNGSYVTESGDVGNWARGGLVPREHHQDGEKVEPPPAEVPPPIETEKSPSFLSSISNYFGSGKPSFAETIFNKGQPFSDEARAGVLAAGLGMLASRSPFPLVAVGEGGLSGLNTYYNALKNKMETAKAGSEINLQTAQAEEQRAQAKAKGIESFEKIKQIYNVQVSDNGEIKVYGFGNQEVPLSTYINSMKEVARNLGVPVESLISEHVRSQNGEARGGRAGKAIGGPLNGLDDMTDKTGLAAAPVAPTPSTDIAVKPEEPSLRDLAIASLKLPTSMPIEAKPVVAEAKPMGLEEKPVQMAQAAPKTTTDAAVTPPQEAEDLHPTLKRIIGLNEQSKKLYQEADDIDGPKGLVNTYLNMSETQKSNLRAKAAAKRTQALQYETQANELMKVEQMSPSGIKYRWEYGSQEPENAPPPAITPETPRGQIDPDTGRIKTAPVDLGYPATGGLPMVKLGKHQVRVGEDPLLIEATKASQEKLKDFQEKAAGTHEGIVNAVKFAAALKVLQSGALTGNAVALGAIAKDLGFDAIANELALGKDIGAAEIGLKSQVSQGLAILQQNFSRPTQSEFSIITEKAAPAVTQRPESAHSLSVTALAGMLRDNALMRDWQAARAKGARNFDAYDNYWRQVNDRSTFEDAADRLIGNFKGQPLTPESKIVESGVYVIPSVEKGKPVDPHMQALLNAGDGEAKLSPGDFFTAKNVRHYKDKNGVDRVSYDIEKLSPEEIYPTMLRMPGIAYGAR